MNVMKEREIDALVTLWVNAHVAYLLVVWWAMATTDNGNVTNNGTNIITQALPVKDGFLPQSLTVQNTYMELCKGSKVVAVVVRNSTAYPQMLRRGTPVARAVMVTQILELTVLSR